MIQLNPSSQSPDPFLEQALFWQQCLRKLIENVQLLRGNMMACGYTPSHDHLAQVLFLLSRELTTQQQAYRQVAGEAPAAPLPRPTVEPEPVLPKPSVTLHLPPQQRTRPLIRSAAPERTSA